MKNDQKEVKLVQLTLDYERQISKAHTIFSSFWDIFFGVIIGGLGVALGLYQISVLQFNKYSFIIVNVILIFIISLAGFVAYYFWFESREHRKKISESIMKLGQEL
ncbi:hypothetical protein HYU19_01975 [Candidatus Woesearchaeota archaeon]|nr:hypothetical protein [Candidatus Woesearchaeota archaeon]